MMTRIHKILRQNESGFILVELMIAVVIAVIIAGCASAGLYQLFSVNSASSNTVVVTKNVESAAHYLIRDVQMSQDIGRTETEWLWLEWTWDGDNHRVAYEIEDDKLYRTHTVSGLTEACIRVAEYIDAGQTEWHLLSEGVSEETVEITISASADGYRSTSETRTVHVVPRVTS